MKLLSALIILFAGTMDVSAQTNAQPLLKLLSFPQANKALINNSPAKVTVTIPDADKNRQYPAKENEDARDNTMINDLRDRLNNRTNAMKALL